ncbi:MAG TPA: serine hydrolase [Patescibacteria group bacterium]|nr:serine hydrolase [Patescibacteria group bacterium]
MRLLSFTMLVLMTILTGCGNPVDLSPVDGTQTNTPRSDQATAIVTPQTTMASSPSPEIFTTPQPQESDIPIGEDTIHNEADVDRCGLLLPIVSLPAEPQKLAKNFDIPTDMVPDEALPALERLVSAPESVALVAYQVGRESEGVYHNAEQPMPLASVVKIITLIAYAEAVAEGILDPAEWISLEELNGSYLPGSDLGAHTRALSELDDRGLIGRDPLSVPLEEVPWMMIRHSSNAASDYIHLALGQKKIESTAIQLGLVHQTAPCPWIGQFLVMNNNERATSNDRAAVQEMIADPEEYGREVMRLTRLFTNDPEFHQGELSQRWRSDMSTQRLFGDNLNAQGTAREYADLMAQILHNGLSSAYVNILTRRALEWPTELAVNQEYFDVVGYKNGSLPGILTTVYYGQRREDGAQVVLALFFRDLPMNTYRNWRQSLAHDEFARWLLMEPSAIQLLDQLLQDGAG